MGVTRETAASGGLCSSPLRYVVDLDTPETCMSAGGDYRQARRRPVVHQPREQLDGADHTVIYVPMRSWVATRCFRMSSVAR